MHVQPYTDPVAFAADVTDFLLRDEANRCVALGVIETLVKDPERFPLFHLFRVVDAGETAGVAWMTPPHPLGITSMTEPALATLVDAASNLAESVSELLGPRPAVDSLLELWSRKTGASVLDIMGQRVYQLNRVISAPQAAGRMRVAGPGDRELVADWTLRFCVDCRMPCTAEEARATAERTTTAGTRWLWCLDDGTPVAMAGCAAPTPHGMRIGAVYTPDDRRGHGYASALVAALSQRQLDQGRRFSFLFTDLSNPVSNRIYQRIGYQPAGDSARYRLAPKSS